MPPRVSRARQGNWCLAQQPSIDKVLILADDDRVLCAGVLPNGRIVGRLQASVEHVRGVVAVAGDPSRQPWGELSVNKEIQALWSTAWSAWRAA